MNNCILTCQLLFAAAPIAFAIFITVACIPLFSMFQVHWILFACFDGCILGTGVFVSFLLLWAMGRAHSKWIKTERERRQEVVWNSML